MPVIHWRPGLFFLGPEARKTASGNILATALDLHRARCDRITGIVVAVAKRMPDNNARQLLSADRPEHLAVSVKPKSRLGFFVPIPRKNPELDAEIAAKVGKINPTGVRETRRSAGFIPHNPYVALLNALLLVGAGVYFYVAMEQKAVWVGFWFGLFIALVGLQLGFFSIRRMSAWHAARAVAADYVARHGGEFPKELRIWG